MATKNCPHCNKQVPVACKKCGCGHVFFATRRSANSVSRERESRENAADAGADTSDQSENPSGDQHQPTRRSGRVTRERPNFYDALEYENQTRREEETDDDWNLEQDWSSDDDQPYLLSRRNRKLDVDRIFRRIFVSVGTTRFDDLVKLMLKRSTIEQFQEWGTRCVLIQKGNGATCTGWFKTGGVEFETYNYKHSIVDDIKWSNLVICHAGAGTTIEALDLGKALVVVPNRALMDDHQLELATKLKDGKHAIVSSIDNFTEDLKKVKRSYFQPFLEKRTAVFGDYMNHYMFRI